MLLRTARTLSRAYGLADADDCRHSPSYAGAWQQTRPAFLVAPREGTSLNSSLGRRLHSSLCRRLLCGRRDDLGRRAGAAEGRGGEAFGVFDRLDEALLLGESLAGDVEG